LQQIVDGMGQADAKSDQKVNSQFLQASVC